MLNTGTVDQHGVVALLTAILTDQPRLSGAACIGRHELYDPIRRNEPGFQRHEQSAGPKRPGSAPGAPRATTARM